MFMFKARSRVVDVPGVVWVLTRPLFIVAVMLALLVTAGVAYAQGTPTVPTIESVAVTSDSGEDGGYAIGDEIQVGLTFSEAVTVTGIPQLTLDVGGRTRTAEYSEGTTTTQLLFTYTVSSGDEDADGIAVVANSLALNGGAIQAGSVNAALTHAGLQSDDHKVDGIAPKVTVGGETRTYVPPGCQFNVIFYFSEKVYGITDAEITVTNGEAHDMWATSGNDTWPKYTRWDVIIQPAAEGPVSVTLEAGAATDAYGNGNTAPESALEVIAADPVMVEVTRATSGFAEGGKAAFMVTRSRDNGAIPVSLSVAQTGDLLSGAVEVYPPTDPNNPDEPVTPQELTFLIALPLVEGGEAGTYSLVLDSQPTDTVVITLAGQQDGFLRIVPDTLTFTTSDWATPQTVSVMALDDGIAGGGSPQDMVTHQVSGGDYGSETAPDILTSIEDTTEAFVYLEGGKASESDGHVEFTVTVRPILRTTPVLVRYSTVDGTAMAGSDYTWEVETGQNYKILNIPAGQSSATIRIPITDDQVYESADETFTLQLTNHNNRATLDGGATSLTATGAIADDDPKPVVSVAGPAGAVSYVSENVKGPVTFTLTLMGQSAGDVTVDYATGEAGLLGLLTSRQGPAGATEDEDYAGASGTVTFTSGQTTKTVAVQVTDDDVSEETEFFDFKISRPQGADLRGQRSEVVADVGLVDDDARGATIDPTSISLDEPASGETAVTDAYTVNLKSRPTDTVTVTIGGGDAAVSLSGDTLTNNRLTFTTTNWNTAQTITVTPVKDDNAVGETVTLTHTLSGGDYAGIATDSVTINLTDSDTRNLVLSRPSLTLTEGDAAGMTFTVRLATEPSGSVSVSITGHSGTDLTLSSTTLTFTVDEWDDAQTVTVTAEEDDDGVTDAVATLTHTASGGDYANVTGTFPSRSRRTTVRG